MLPPNNACRLMGLVSRPIVLECPKGLTSQKSLDSFSARLGQNHCISGSRLRCRPPTPLPIAVQESALPTSYTTRCGRFEQEDDRANEIKATIAASPSCDDMQGPTARWFAVPRRRTLDPSLGSLAPN